MFDPTHDALASTKMPEESPSVEVEAPFRVPVSGGLRKVKIHGRADEAGLRRSVLLSLWRWYYEVVHRLPVSSQSRLQ